MEKAESKTTTVGMVFGDKVVLAADKRATAGTTIYHKNVRKIATITNKAALTISGLVADAQFLVENAKYFAKTYEFELNKPVSIRNLASYLSTLLSLYLRYYPFIVQLLLGGYDVEPSLYYIDLYGTVTKEKYIATGSGSPIALGVLESKYNEDLKLEDAVEIAITAVKSAMSRDGFSGEGIDVVVIGKDGIVLEKTFKFKKTAELST